MSGSGAPEFRATGEAAADLEISAGDALHLPRGWWHLVTPVDEPSVHLTIGATQRTGVHFLAWLSEEMRQESVFRKDLPRSLSRDAQVRHLRELRETLDAYLEDPDTLDRYFSSCSRTAYKQSKFNLPFINESRGAAGPDKEQAGHPR